MNVWLHVVLLQGLRNGGDVIKKEDDPNGKLKEEVCQPQPGHAVLFSDDENNAGLVFYVFSRRPIGEQRFYNEAGRLVRLELYDNQGRLQHEKAWNDAGVIVRDDAVFEDGSRKNYQ